MQTIPGTGYGSASAVTPSDTTQVNCRALWVGGVGNVAVKTAPGATAVTLTAVPAGTLLPLMIDGGQVMSTNTTATLIIALA